MTNTTLTQIAETLSSTTWMEELESYEARVYLVGGIVRDSFLDKESKDIDLVVEGLELGEIKHILLGFGVVKENNVGDRFKVLKFIPSGWEGEPIDVATPRKDFKVAKGHKGFIAEKAKNIREDLKRRDFTINSIAYDITNRKLIDPFGGLKDLKKGIIRATDYRAFAEDPLRLLRAIQFAARFEFGIQEWTKKLMGKHAWGIKEITGERILDEFKKVVSKGGNTQIVFDLLSETRIDRPLLGSYLHAENHGPLDDLSFFYTLCKAGNRTEPRQFYMHNLKGDSTMGDEIEVLDELLTYERVPLFTGELEYKVFKALKKTPNLGRAFLLPDSVDRIISKMRSGTIPMFADHIALNGWDVRETLGIGEGREVGRIMETVVRASLRNAIDWKSESKLKEFIKTL